jgi:hypothetical protein
VGVAADVAIHSSQFKAHLPDCVRLSLEQEKSVQNGSGIV